MKPLNLETILLALRDRIAFAIEHDERRLLGRLYTALEILEEAAYGTDNKRIYNVILTLQYVAQEGSMGFGFEKQLPPREKIIEAFQTIREDTSE